MRLYIIGIFLITYIILWEDGYLRRLWNILRCMQKLALPILETEYIHRTLLGRHHQLLAHAAAYAVYKEKFKATQGGEVGLVLDCEWAEAFSDKEEDKIATERRLDFQLGWYLDPIFYGDYPAVMRQRLGDKLPKLSEKDKELLSNAIDFVGLNHYTSRFISHVQKPRGIHFYQMQEMERIAKWNNGEVIGDKAASEWLYIVPWGIRRTLNYIATRYRNPKICNRECMDEEDSEISTLSEALNDTKRVGYFKGYIAAVAQAIRSAGAAEIEVGSKTCGPKNTANRRPARVLRLRRRRPVPLLPRALRPHLRSVLPHPPPDLLQILSFQSLIFSSSHHLLYLPQPNNTTTPHHAPPPSNLWHEMSDEELLQKAATTTTTMAASCGGMAEERKKVAFMFLTRGRMPLAPLWERFFRGHDSRLFSVYVHAPTPEFTEEPPRGSVFFRRRIPARSVASCLANLLL
uniref:Beta-glucosidase 42 n=1 Tax=Ananas comosus var. bracteatus TaxID=296719 RepID=A0A6V7PW73_ANACO|nr:unnamed protein product [Ananas comosus var. bracteatus]